jgi:hypothetical protein
MDIFPFRCFYEKLWQRKVSSWSFFFSRWYKGPWRKHHVITPENHASEALSLLYLSRNIINGTYEPSLGVERPSTGVSQHCQQPLVQNTVEVNDEMTTNAIKKGINAPNTNPIS